MTTNRDLEAVIGMMFPQTMKHLQQLIMDAEACSKNFGQKSLFGRDKFKPAHEKFCNTLAICIISMEKDGMIKDSNDYPEALKQVDWAMQMLKQTYSNWPLSFQFWEAFYQSESGIANKREDPDREGLRNDFVRVTTRLRAADPASQMAIGHGINMANSLFLQRFDDIAGFRRLSKPEKLNYIKALTNTEKDMAKEHPHASIGFALFKMWIAALTEEDEELLQEFSIGLDEFSRKGDLLSGNKKTA